MTTNDSRNLIPRENRVMMDGRAIPRVMSTQHPDNAKLAPFSDPDEEVIKGEGEIAEAEYVFSKLGADEQMWDYEGKGADVDVVLKLLLKNTEFFRNCVLGQDAFLTLRIPNPTVEQELRKKFEESLHTIVTSYDLASSFYKAPIAPIFDVILPFTTTAQELVWVDSYYREVVIGTQDHVLPGGLKVRDWLGEYRPEVINMIPLVEDTQSVLHVDKMIEEYVANVQRPITGMRVFIARSDPALNYGMVSATLSAKVAMQRLDSLSNRLGIPLYPMIGMGAVPFRGNFRPSHVQAILEEYPSVQTFTIQSSFKYDNDQKSVRDAVAQLHAHTLGKPTPIDEERASDLVERFTKAYADRVAQIADLVNRVSAFIPQRRDRRLHVGLFGYSRSSASEGHSDVRLPRAITYAASLYSVGVPPELIGTECLTEDDFRFLKEVNPHFEEDMADACMFANESTVEKVLGKAGVDMLHRFQKGVDAEHRGFTSLIYDEMKEVGNPARAKQLIAWAAEARQFLG